MFTDEDYEEYFEQIAGLERLMVYSIHELLPKIEDATIRLPLEEVAKDEIRHYAYIRAIFDSILVKSDLEKRKFTREHRLGKALVKVIKTGLTYEGYCLDISTSGACVEFDQELPIDTDLEVRIEPFDGQEAKTYLGKFAWNARINPHLQMGNIKFKAGIQFSAS